MRKLTFIFLIILLALPFGASFAHDEEACKAVLLLDFRARASVAPTSATYGIIVNLTEEDITLSGGSTDRAEAVEIHSMTVGEDDVMMMMPLADGLTIPPQTAAEFAPGGLHVMVIGLTDFFVADDSYELVLDFGNVGEASLSVPIVDIDEDMSDMGDMSHDEMEPAATEEAEMSDMGREVSFSVLGECDDLEGVTIGEAMDMGDDHEGETLSLTLVFADGAEVVHNVAVIMDMGGMDMDG